MNPAIAPPDGGCCAAVSGWVFTVTTLYMRDCNAERLGLSLPSGQNAARTFTTWIRTIHTAAVGGLLMQVLVSALGLFVAVLTGVVIFARKRAA